MKGKGTYALLWRLERETSLQVGRLGDFVFPAGYYVYLGSALGGLSSRVQRHRRGASRPHWHLDYLRPYLKETGLWCRETRKREECRWAQALLSLPGAQVPAPGFGSSDCRCPSHLVHFTRQPALRTFLKALKKLMVDHSPGQSPPESS